MLRTRVVISTPTGSPDICVMHFMADVEDQAAADNAISKAKAFWHEMTSVWQPTTRWDSLPNVDVINSATGALEGQFTVTVGGEPGFVAGADYLPPATQGLMRWDTAGIVHGRRVRGRTNIPGLLESSSGPSGQPAGQLVTTNAPNAAAAMITAGAARFAIWSRPVTAAEATPTVPVRAGTVWEVTGGQLLGKFAVLRSRRD